MKFYHIKNDYINFLRIYDTKVAENKQESRPYVGIVLKIKDIDYYAPFTSPKPKHLNMKNTKDFRKIANGEYGAINFNNMIPVSKNALLLIDIENEPDQNYKRLLQNQYRSILSDSEAIIKTATRLHSLVLTNSNDLSVFDLKVKKRCCNLKLLESVYMLYDA